MKVKIFPFANKNVVSTHIECYWVEASDVVMIQLTSGATLKETVKKPEEGELILKNIEDFITGNLHV